MNPYLNPWFLPLLAWSFWAGTWECTKCGSQHPLSQCRWPAAEQERN